MVDHFRDAAKKVVISKMERTTILLTKIILNMEDDSMISGIKRGGDFNV